MKFFRKNLENENLGIALGVYFMERRGALILSQIGMSAKKAKVATEIYLSILTENF